MEETENRLSLKGTIDDSQRTKLVGQSIKTIAHETALERIQREIVMLNDIHQCTWQKRNNAIIRQQIRSKNRSLYPPK